MINNAATGEGKEIIYEQAPCQEDGIISSKGQQESKEGECECARGKCCVDGMGIILPRRLKPKQTYDA